MTNELFDDVVDIAEEYLGPAAHRFIARQVMFHLGKDPSELVVADLPKLAEWVKVTVALLTEDHNLIEVFISRVTQLDKLEASTREW